MAVRKRKYRSRQECWYYMFDLPGTRGERTRISASGFATKREAQDAEAIRRAEEQKKLELAKAGASIAAPLPKTLAMLLEEFFRQHVNEKLAAKTIERYREQRAYIDAELLAMSITEITPLHLSHRCG